MKLPNKIRMPILVIAIAWGMLLGIGGIISGNQAFTAPNSNHLAKELLKEKIDPNRLNCMITNERGYFRVVEFSKSDGCLGQSAGIDGYACFKESSLDDATWVRQQFQNPYKELIVIADTPQSTLSSAIKLKEFGYSVRMVDTSEPMLFASNEPDQDQAEQKTQPAASDPILVPVESDEPLIPDVASDDPLIPETESSEPMLPAFEEEGC